MRSPLATLACLALLALAPASAEASIAYIGDTGVPTAEGEPGEANGRLPLRPLPVRPALNDEGRPAP